MKKLVFLILAAFVLTAIVPSAFAAKYWPDKWWPSKWGPDDEKGSFNTNTPAKIMSSLKIPKSGKVYRLGMPYTNDMPVFGSRVYKLHIPGLPAGGPLGENQVVWNDEFVVGEIGQVGTQFDAQFHVGIRGPDGVDRWYNGRALNSPENVYGSLKHNGVERLGPIVTRGVLIDVAGLKGVDSMQIGEVITLADVENCIKKAGIAPIGEGDAVIFRMGWVGKYWKDAKTFASGCPGIGMEVAQYLIKKNVGMTGTDTWPIESIPSEDPKGAFYIHNLLETVNGIWNIENLSSDTLGQMAKDGVYDFLFVYIPVPLAGATGSPGEPIAIK
jgi:kynurenine formamidase